MKELIKKLTEKQQREFALICACRAVDRIDNEEIISYFTLICLAVEADMLEEIKGVGEYELAYCLAERSAEWSANTTKEKQIQKEILLNFIEGN